MIIETRYVTFSRDYYYEFENLTESPEFCDLPPIFVPIDV